MAAKLVARILSCGRSTRAPHARSASHARNLSVTRPHPSTRRPIIECVMSGTNNIFPLVSFVDCDLESEGCQRIYLIDRMEGVSLGCCANGRVCRFRGRTSWDARLRTPGESLRVRETHARTVRLVARARAVVLSVSVEKPSACLGGIHACLTVLQRGTRH